MFPKRNKMWSCRLQILPFALLSAVAQGNDGSGSYPIEIPLDTEEHSAIEAAEAAAARGVAQDSDPEVFDSIEPSSETKGESEPEFYQPVLPSESDLNPSPRKAAPSSSAPPNPVEFAPPNDQGAENSGIEALPLPSPNLPSGGGAEAKPATATDESVEPFQQSAEPTFAQPEQTTKPDAEPPPQAEQEPKADFGAPPPAEQEGSLQPVPERKASEPKPAKKKLNQKKQKAGGEVKAQPKPTEPPVPSYFQDKSELKFSVGLENVLIGELSAPTVDFGLFSDDKILLPWLSLRDHIYPSFKLSNGRSFQFNARSRIHFAHERATKSNRQDQLSTTITADAGEVFAVLKPSAEFSLTAGKQNFQWGPAELRSPSNWIFRPTRLADSMIRNPQSEVETRDLVRMNFSLGQQMSLVAMAEYETERQNRARLFSGRRMLLKPEFSWNNGANSIGLVLGAAEKQGFPFWGQYATYAFTDALQAYVDAGQYQGGDISLPRRISVPGRPQADSFIVYDQTELRKQDFNYEFVIGARYTLLDNIEVRAEAYANSLGLDDVTLRDAQALERGNSPFLPVFFQPGVEVQSKSGLLFAARRNNFGFQNKWTSLVRYLKPFDDSSGLFVAYGEYIFSDNTVFFASVGGYHGDNVSAAAVAQRFSFSLGHKHVW